MLTLLPDNLFQIECEVINLIIIMQLNLSIAICVSITYTYIADTHSLLYNICNCFTRCYDDCTLPHECTQM